MGSSCSCEFSYVPALSWRLQKVCYSTTVTVQFGIWVVYIKDGHAEGTAAHCCGAFETV